jgi:drug/metabolite transporter (DMT)-like permease
MLTKRKSEDDNNSYIKTPSNSNNDLFNNFNETDITTSQEESMESAGKYEYYNDNENENLLEILDDNNNNKEIKKSNKNLYKLFVLMICMIWSTNFTVIKEIFLAVPGIKPSLYSAIRFNLAGFILLPNTFGYWKLNKLSIGAMIVGSCKFCGYWGQATGLVTGSANKSSFICSMNVVWVAFLTSIREWKFSIQTWTCVLLAVSGAAYLELSGSSEPSMNDIYLCIMPFGFGTAYFILEILLGKSSQIEGNKEDNAAAVTAFMLMTVGFHSTLWAIYQGNTLDDLLDVMESKSAVFFLLYTGFFTTASMIWLQAVTFKEVSATDGSIILSTEPIWGNF